MDEMLQALGLPKPRTWILNVAPDYALELIDCDGQPHQDRDGRSFRYTHSQPGTGQSPFCTRSSRLGDCQPEKGKTESNSKPANDLAALQGDPSKGEAVMAGFNNSPYCKVIQQEDDYHSFFGLFCRKLGIESGDLESNPAWKARVLDGMIAILGFPHADAWVLKIAADYRMELIPCDGAPNLDTEERTFRYTHIRRSPFSTKQPA